MSDPIEVLDFWLGEIGPDGWYSGTPEVDDACAAGFGELLEALSQDGLEHWVEGTVGTLAYLIVADQFSRNIHRGTAAAFATDARARAAAHRAIGQDWDLDAPEPERQFFYMPFVHSEALEEQDLAVRLMTERLAGCPEQLLHARAHREVIRRFGRFPYRNQALGRENTLAEDAFLAEGGYPALVASMTGTSHAPDA